MRRGMHPQDRSRVTVELRRERAREATSSSPTSSILEGLCLGYTKDELAAALRFMQDITATPRAAARLTEDDSMG